MSVSGGGIAGIIFGSLIGIFVLFLILLVFLRFWMRGPTKGTDNKKKLDGRVVAITGCSAGIGKVTAMELARRGARIIMLSRDMKKAEAAAVEIRDETGAKVDVEHLDLASLKSVRECAQRLLEKEDKIDILINNAGVVVGTHQKTEDGYEMHFGTNHLGHFLLTELLKPLIMKSSASGFHPRIVIVSALAHTHIRGMNWDDLNWERRFSPWPAYSQSKLANILHAKELAHRLENTGISVYVLHPGVIKTELGRDMTHWIFRCVDPFFTFAVKTPFYGAQTTLYCALDDAIECESGMYYSDCAKKAPSAAALIKEDQKKLWTISENMVGIKSDK